MYFPCYSYHKNPAGREFFVPTGTLIAVKLLTTHYKFDYEFEVWGGRLSIRVKYVILPK